MLEFFFTLWCYSQIYELEFCSSGMAVMLVCDIIIAASMVYYMRFRFSFSESHTLMLGITHLSKKRWTCKATKWVAQKLICLFLETGVDRYCKLTSPESMPKAWILVLACCKLIPLLVRLGNQDFIIAFLIHLPTSSPGQT